MTWRSYRDLRGAFYAQAVHDAARKWRLVSMCVCAIVVSLGLLWSLDTTPTPREAQRDWSLDMSFYKIRYNIYESRGHNYSNKLLLRFEEFIHYGTNGEVWLWENRIPSYNSSGMEAAALVEFFHSNASVHAVVTIDGSMPLVWRDVPGVSDGHALTSEVVWVITRVVVTVDRDVQLLVSEKQPALYVKNFDVVVPTTDPAFFVLLVVVICWIDISCYLREKDSPFERTLVGQGFASVMQLVRLLLNWTYTTLVLVCVFAIATLFRRFDWSLLWVGASYCAASQSYLLLLSYIFDDVYVANVTSILFWILSAFTSDVLEYADAPPSIVYSALVWIPNFALRSSFRYRDIQHIRASGQMVVYGNFFRDLLDWSVDWATLALLPWVLLVPLLVLVRHICARQDTRYATIEGDGVMRLTAVGQNFGKVRLFDGINVLVECSERLVLEGANGTGKSTLLGIMASGQCSDGVVAALSGLVVRMCSQATRLEDELTAQQHLKTVLLLEESGAFDVEQHIADLCDRLDIPRYVIAGEMSGGMRRKLLLAMAIATPCGLLLLDEPTNNIDVDSRCKIWNVLVQCFCTSMVIATHDKTEARILGTRILRIEVYNHSGLRVKGTIPQRFQLTAMSPSTRMSRLLEKWRNEKNYRVRDNTVHTLFKVRDFAEADTMDEILACVTRESRDDDTTTLVQLKSVPREEFPENPLNTKMRVDVAGYPDYIDNFENRAENLVRSVWGFLVLRADYEFLRACGTAKIFALLGFILLCGTLLVCIVRAPIDHVDIDLSQLDKPAIVLMNITRPSDYMLVTVAAAVMERVHGELLFRETLGAEDFYTHNIIGGITMLQSARDRVGENRPFVEYMDQLGFFAVGHRAYSLESMTILRARIWEAFIRVYELDQEIPHVDVTVRFKFGPGLIDPVGQERFDVAIVAVFLYACVGFVLPLRHAVDEQTSQFRAVLLGLGVRRSVMLLADVLIDSVVLCVVVGGLVIFEHFSNLALGGWALLPMFVAQLPFVYVWAKFTTHAIGHFFVLYMVTLPLTGVVRLISSWWAHVGQVVALLDVFVPPLSLGHWLWERTHFEVFNGNDSIDSLVCGEWSTLAASQCCRIYNERYRDLWNGTVQPCRDAIQSWEHEANRLVATQHAVAFVIFILALYFSLCFCRHIAKKVLRRWYPSTRADALHADCIEARVSKVRGGKSILSNCEFLVERGTHAMIVGPNGAGKSTLMDILAARLNASSGNPRLVLNGRTYKPHHRSYSKNVTYMRQENFINPWQSTGRIVDVLCHILNVDSTLGRELLSALNIPNFPVFAQSGGNQRKLCLILTMLAPNPVVMFDEPLVGADKASRLVFFKLVGALLAKERIVISSSHTPRDTLSMVVELWRLHDEKVRRVHKPPPDPNYIVVLIFANPEQRSEWLYRAHRGDVEVVNYDFSLGSCSLILILRTRRPMHDVMRLARQTSRAYKECLAVPACFSHVIV